ncbi:dephospho-CoA kinase [Candidatus Dehalogenimonas loeffleri]|jgi:dephospho-CoA kinase|uniref:Dephospho-CoA kinase n=1 Tax=Candidatus Dehalogenimonas loeffleri TaxID=3127115 RepID=A0ABZ2J1S9_9CHLR
MITIGLTGGIGSGKSTVGAMLKDLGAAFIDADKVGHRLLREDEALKAEIVRLFGEDIVNGNGQIDRRRLAGIVFSDPAALNRLNAVTHPLINRAVAAEVAQLRQDGYQVIVVEAPLLVEAGWAAESDTIWLTVAPAKVVLKRLVEKMGYTEAEAGARIASQTSNDERRRYAAEVIDTDTSLEELKIRVERLWRGL